MLHNKTYNNNVRSHTAAYLDVAIVGADEQRAELEWVGVHLRDEAQIARSGERVGRRGHLQRTEHAVHPQVEHSDLHIIAVL